VYNLSTIAGSNSSDSSILDALNKLYLLKASPSKVFLKVVFTSSDSIKPLTFSGSEKKVMSLEVLSTPFIL